MRVGALSSRRERDRTESKTRPMSSTLQRGATVALPRRTFARCQRRRSVEHNGRGIRPKVWFRTGTRRARGRDVGVRPRISPRSLALRGDDLAVPVHSPFERGVGGRRPFVEESEHAITIAIGEQAFFLGENLLGPFEGSR